MATQTNNPDWKKGSAELLILAILEARPRHGYEISKLIEQRSGGAVRFHVASLYPLLYRLEKRVLLEGRWVEKAGQRRRRYYTLTPEGQKVLAAQRHGWQAFVEAISRITSEVTSGEWRVTSTGSSRSCKDVVQCLVYHGRMR